MATVSINGAKNAAISGADPRVKHPKIREAVKSLNYSRGRKLAKAEKLAQLGVNEYLKGMASK